MKFEHVSIYNGIGFKKKLKAPTDHCFVLKVHDSCLLRCTTEVIYRLLPKAQQIIYVWHKLNSLRLYRIPASSRKVKHSQIKIEIGRQ